MGNRLSRSPKTRQHKDTSAAKAQSAEAAQPRRVEDHQGDALPSLSIADGSDPTRPATGAWSPSTWPLVQATLQAVDAFHGPAEQANERRRKRLAVVGEDPELFFAFHDTASDDQRGGPSLEDVSLQYTQALLLKAQGDWASAVALLRPLAGCPALAPMAADARVHLTQCLLLLDPTLLTNARELDHVLAECVAEEVQAKILNAELAVQAKELHAYLRLAFRDATIAQSELRESNSLGVGPTPREVAFQARFCRHLAEVDAWSHLDDNADCVDGEAASADMELLAVDAEALCVDVPS